MNRTELINRLTETAEIPVSEGEMFLEMFLRRVSSEITPGHNYYLPQLGTFIFEKGPDDESVFTFPETDENISFTLPHEEKIFSYSKFSLSIGKPVFPTAGKSEKFNYLLRPNENISSLEAKAEKLSFLVEEGGLITEDFASEELSIYTDTIDITEDAGNEDEQLQGIADLSVTEEQDEEVTLIAEAKDEEVTPVAEEKEEEAASITEEHEEEIFRITDEQNEEVFPVTDEQEEEVSSIFEVRKEDSVPEENLSDSIESGKTEEELPGEVETGITEPDSSEESEILYEEKELQVADEDKETVSEPVEIPELREEGLTSIEDETPGEPAEDNIILDEDTQSESYSDFDEDDLASYKETEAVYEETPETAEETSPETNFEELAEQYAQDEQVEGADDLGKEESSVYSAEIETFEIQLPPEEDGESFKSLVTEDDFKIMPEDLSPTAGETLPEDRSSDDKDVSENYQRVKSLTREFLSFNEQNRKEDKLTWDFGESEELDKDIKAITKSFDEPDKNSQSNKEGYTFIQAKRSTMEWSPGTLPDLESILPEEDEVPEEIKINDEPEVNAEDIVTDTVKVKKHRRREQKSRKPFIITAVIVVLAAIAVLAYYKINSGALNSAENIEPVIIERNDPVPVMIIGEVEKTGAGKDESVPAFSQPEEVVATEEETPAVRVADMLFKKGDLYFVQVSSWKVRSNAVKDSDRYLLLGYKTEIQSAINNSTRYYRVLVGGFKTTDEVEEFKQKKL